MISKKNKLNVSLFKDAQVKEWLITACVHGIASYKPAPRIMAKNSAP